MMNQELIGTMLLGLLWLAAGTAPAHAGTKHYYYTDAQGTVLAKADAQGNIVASYDYAPYGGQVLGPSTSGPSGYTGHVNDADTGLVYMQARYYDPAVGRFLSVDSVGPATGDAFNFNRYAYANNNPIANIDPDGRQSFRGFGSTLEIYADCHQAKNCADLAQVNEMTHKDAEFFVKVQGGIIVTTFTAVVAPAAIVPVAKVVKEKRKEVSKQIFCILALTSPCNSERIDGRKYDPDLTTIQQQQSLIRMEEQIKNAERLRQKATQQPPAPPPPTPT